MTKASDARAKRRAQKLLAERVERVIEGDRRFFLRFPDRVHRVRVESVAEYQLGCSVHDLSPDAIPPGLCRFIAVKRLADGCRIRVSFVGPDSNETDLSEEDARAAYELAASMAPRLKEVERSLSAALAHDEDGA